MGTNICLERVISTIDVTKDGFDVLGSTKKIYSPFDCQLEYVVQNGIIFNRDIFSVSIVRTMNRIGFIGIQVESMTVHIFKINIISCNFVLLKFN